MNNRINLLDYLKGFAIFLVIFGHSIQYGSGITYFKKMLFFENIFFKVIYSFHMPLFMLISGFLFYNSKNKNFKIILINRVKLLLIPIFMWQTLYFSLSSILNKNLLDKSLLNINFIKIYITNVLSGLWFLWAIFFCSSIVLLVNILFKNENLKIIIFILGFILTFFIPDIQNSALYKFMYPYFIIGYYNSDFIKKINSLKNSSYFKYMFFTLILFLFLLKYFNYDSYIYTTGYFIFNPTLSPMKHIIINIYRFIIGLVGSLLTILIFNKMDSIFNYNKIIFFKRILLKLGQDSLGLYIITGYLFLILPGFKYLNMQNYFYNFLESFLLIAVSFICIHFIKKYKVLNFLLLGNRK